MRLLVYRVVPMPNVGAACSGIPTKGRFGSLSPQGTGSRTWKPDMELCSQIPQFSLRYYLRLLVYRVVPMPNVGAACSGIPTKGRFGSLSPQGSGSRTWNLCSQIPQFSLRSYYAIACLTCGANAISWYGVLWDPDEGSVRILEPAGIWEPDMGAGHVTCAPRSRRLD